MPISFKTLIFLVVPGSSMLLDSPEEGDTGLLKPRSPAEINGLQWWHQDNGLNKEPGIPDDKKQMPGRITDSYSPHFNTGQYSTPHAVRAPFIEPDSTISADIGAKIILAPPSKKLESNAERAVSFKAPNGFDGRSYPPLVLTPQDFFHIKIAIPKAIYDTHVYEDDRDVEVVEVITKSNARINDVNIFGANTLPPTFLPPREPNRYSNYGTIHIPASYPMQPQTGWSETGSGQPDQRIISGFKPNQQNEKSFQLFYPGYNIGGRNNQNNNNFNNNNPNNNNFNNNNPNNNNFNNNDPNNNNFNNNNPNSNNFNKNNNNNNNNINNNNNNNDKRDNPVENSMVDNEREPYYNYGVQGGASRSVPEVQPYGEPNNQVVQYTNPSIMQTSNASSPIRKLTSSAMRSIGNTDSGRSLLGASINNEREPYNNYGVQSGSRAPQFVSESRSYGEPNIQMAQYTNPIDASSPIRQFSFPANQLGGHLDYNKGLQGPLVNNEREPYNNYGVQGGARAAPFVPEGQSYGDPNNQMVQYTNPSITQTSNASSTIRQFSVPGLRTVGYTDYNKGLQNPGDTIVTPRLYSRGSRDPQPGLSSNIPNGDPTLRNAIQETPQAPNTLLSAVRSLD